MRCQLRNGVALLDNVDYVFIINNSLHVYEFLASNKWPYVKTCINGKRVLLHRILMQATLTNVYVDHINGNGLDNRRSNIRLASNSENQGNRQRLFKPGGKHSTPYKGVSFFPIEDRPNLKNRYAASIKFKGKTHSLGCYFTAEEAALAYNKKAIEFFGEFAYLNTLPEGYTPPQEEAFTRVSLSEQDVLDIRELSSSLTRKELATKYRVTVTCIRSIIIRKTWKYL